MVADPEVLIVGGGPAGASLAGLLALRGRRATVIEREAFPRFKIGESLLPQSCVVFEKLGMMERLEAKFIRKYGARFVDSKTGEKVRYVFAEAFDSRFPFAFEVERGPFDKLMLERAVELGAELWQPCRVMDVLFEGERAVGVRVRDSGGEREVTAPIVVDATGRGALLATRLRTKGRLTGLDTAAMFAHYKGLPRYEGLDEGDITIVMFEQGWFWVIPFLGDMTSIGAVVKASWMREHRSDESMEEFFGRTVDDVPWMKDWLKDGYRTMPIATAADFSYSVSRMHGDGWLCLGDANGFIDPLFSTGVHLAFRGADIAAEAIDDALNKGDTTAAAFEGFDQAMRAAAGTFLGVVQGNYSGALREYLFAENQRQMMRRMITSILSGDVYHADAPAWIRFMREHMPARYE